MDGNLPKRKKTNWKWMKTPGSMGDKCRQTHCLMFPGRVQHGVPRLEEGQPMTLKAGLQRLQPRGKPL